MDAAACAAQIERILEVRRACGRATAVRGTRDRHRATGKAGRRYARIGTELAYERRTYRRLLTRKGSSEVTR